MYFCKNCGEPYVTDEAGMCVKCGVLKGQGYNFCHNCGSPIPPQSAYCLNCGVANVAKANAGTKSKIAAGLFGIFLGCYGVHNFYLGYTSKAVIQLSLTIVGVLLLCCYGIGAILIFGMQVWGLVEGIMILADKIVTDANGMPLKD